MHIIKKSYIFLKSDTNAREVFTSILFRSSYYALSAYFIALLLERLIMFTAAAFFGYSIDFGYEYLKIKGDPNSWDQDSVLIIYLFPYFIIAAIIVWLHIRFRNNALRNGFKQVFIYWIMLFFSYRLVGMLPAHLYSFTGIHYAFTWLYWGIKFKVVIGLFSFILFFITSTFLLNQILYLTGIINQNIKTTGSQLLFISAILFPAVICCVVAILFFIPGLPKEEILGLILVVLPVIYIAIRLLYKQPMRSTLKYTVEEVFYQWQIFAVILVLIIIVRIVLGIGISVN
jgi:hypothetical protein